MIKVQVVTNTEIKLSPIAKAVKASIIAVGLVHGAANAATVQVNSSTDGLGVLTCIPQPGVDCAIPGSNGPIICELRELVLLLTEPATYSSVTGLCLLDGEFGVDDRIVFREDLTGETISLTDGRIDIRENMTIDATNIGNITIDGSNQNGIFDIEDSTLTLNNLTVASTQQYSAIDANNSTVTINNSTLLDNSGSFGGAAVNANQSTITINNSAITNNKPLSGGSAFVANNSLLTVNNSSFSENGATSNSGGGFGGAIRIRESELNINSTSIINSTAGYGAAIGTIESIVTITESNISGNFANRRGGAIMISRSTAQSNPSSVSIYSTTLSDNSTNGNGGAIVTSANSGATEFYIVDSTLSRNTAGANGGAVWMRNSSASILNTTFSGNIAQDGDGGAINLVSNYISLSNTTITNNTASDRGSGIFVSTFQVPTPIFHNSILAGNNGNDCESNLGLTSFVIADSFNIIQNDACSTDARNIDPMLGPLANNGGATLSHALLPTSPARNSGDLITCTTEDQRGQLRNNGDNACDVGAIEFNRNDDFGEEEETNFIVIPLSNGRAVVIPN